MRRDAAPGKLRQAEEEDVIDESVLIVDDDETTRSGLQMLLEGEGFAVRTCDSGEAAVGLIHDECFDVLLIDYRMPRMNGDEVTKLLRPLCPDSFILGFSVEPREQTFLRAGADGFLSKHELTRHLIPLMKNRGERG